MNIELAQPSSARKNKPIGTRVVSHIETRTVSHIDRRVIDHLYLVCAAVWNRVASINHPV